MRPGQKDIVCKEAISGSPRGEGLAIGKVYIKTQCGWQYIIVTRSPQDSRSRSQYIHILSTT